MIKKEGETGIVKLPRVAPPPTEVLVLHLTWPVKKKLLPPWRHQTKEGGEEAPSSSTSVNHPGATEEHLPAKEREREREREN